jgi:low affinity Fe/Cu permease
MEDLMEEVRSFFKNVFTRETEEEKERVDEFFRKIEYNQVTEEENNILTVKLKKRRNKKAIMETENNKNTRTWWNTLRIL